MKKCAYDKEKVFECNENPKKDPDFNCPWRREDILENAVCTKIDFADPYAK